MKASFPIFRLVRSAFSLVEMLAVIAIIGVVVFLAIPHLVRIKGDAEDSHARARVEALNMAMAAYLNSVGPTNAATQWNDGRDPNDCYDLVRPFLAFAAPSLAAYQPQGYIITFPTNIVKLEPVTLAKETN